MMSSVKQTAFGSNNTQVAQIFQRPFDVVDICAEGIERVIAKISGIDFFNVQEKLSPPDIEVKNERNKVDIAGAAEINKTYARWDDISVAISSDATGTLAKSFNMSAYVLNQLYLSKFQGDISSFRLHVMQVYTQHSQAGDKVEDAFLVAHLVNYMYLSCKVGLV